jgi:hypothetical protein
VQNAQARAKAKAELATISQALEQFKSRYGDYPWVNTADVEDPEARKNGSHGLLKALVGWQAVDGTQPGNNNSNGELFTKAESILDVSRLSLSEDWPDGSIEADPGVNTYFMDPWGNPYVYIYKEPGPHKLGESGGPWSRFGYILFSLGPDGEASGSGLNEATGELETAFKNDEANLDNIFAGE